MNFPVQINKLAGQAPDKLALVWSEGSYTYKELNGQINRFGRALLNLGVAPGDRIALQLLNCPEFVVAFYAIMKIGAVVVPINPLYKGKDLGDIMIDSGAVALISSPEISDSLNKVRPKLVAFKNLILTCDELQAKGLEAISLASLITVESADEIGLALPEDGLAEIIYTSGTTGMAKGAMLTHHNLYSNALTFAQYMGCTADEKVLIVAPIFHSAAQTCCLNSGIVSGATCYLLERWTTASDTLQALQDWQITFFFGPPTMYTFILGNQNLRDYQLSLRVAFSGAASVPVEIFNKWLDVLGFAIVEGYGLSETSPVVTVNPPLGVQKPGSIGIPIPEVRVQIMDEEGIELAIGEVGEIAVQGPNVMKGYWNNPEATAEFIRDGWFYTGDLGYKDEDGYFFIVDRKKDMINRGGLKVYPREVEEILYRHPAVLEAAVVGIPDKLSTEAVKAFVVLKADQTAKASELKSYCKEQLANYKVPKIIEFVQVLPKTATGKVLKNDLRLNS